MIKFLLIDDHKIIREGLKQILLMHYPQSTFEEEASAEDVLNKASFNYDVIICDLSMQGRSGLDVVKQVASSHPKLPILILSMHPEEHYAIRAFKAGAWGYLNKSAGAEVLIPAVEIVMMGRKYIPASIAEQLAENLQAGNATGDLSHTSLSGREFDIFKLIAEGKSVTDISRQLSLSLSTVSTHRSRILSKMNMKSNAELVRYALENNII